MELGWVDADGPKTSDGDRRWIVKPAVKVEIDVLLDALQSGQYRNQKELGEALGWEKSKVSRMKARAAYQKRIDEKTWEALLKVGDEGWSEDF